MELLLYIFIQQKLEVPNTPQIIVFNYYTGQVNYILSLFGSIFLVSVNNNGMQRRRGRRRGRKRERGRRGGGGLSVWTLKCYQHMVVILYTM